MRYKAILFDLDGTLLDTLEDLATAANRALGTLGLPAHPTDAYRVFVGDGLRTLAERILPGEQRSAAQPRSTRWWPPSNGNTAAPGTSAPRPMRACPRCSTG